MSLKFRTLLVTSILVGIFASTNSFASGTSNLFLPAHVVADEGEVTLYADHWLLVSGYQPVNGAPTTIRYKLYSQDISISSNAG